MIEFTDVVKNYSPDTQALRGVSMQIDDGEFAFLVGLPVPASLPLLR